MLCTRHSGTRCITYCVLSSALISIVIELTWYNIDMSHTLRRPHSFIGPGLGVFQPSRICYNNIY